jgi:ABC-type nitrate/sulfonate/bicarbonate transport system permease component
MTSVGDGRIEVAGGSIPELKAGRRPRLPLAAALAYVASIALGLGIWQLASMHWSATFLPSPYQTWIAAKELWRDGTLPDSIWASSRRILIGWSLGLVVGVPIGLLMGRITIVRRLLDPYIEFFRFIPPIAFVTLTIIWLGIGEASKVVLIFYTSVFIVTINTIAGVLSIDETKLRAAASLGAGRVNMLRFVILPATVPFIVTAARLAMGNSFLTIVSAEIVAAQQGLGALIWTARNYGRTEWVFVGIISLGILGFLFDRVIRILARRILGRYSVAL